MNFDEYDFNQIEKERILSSNNVIFIRGYFIEKTIDLENNIIQLISQYCSESNKLHNILSYTLMKKEVPFSILIKILFKIGILDDLLKANTIKININEFKNHMIKVLEIRNKLAHWIYTNSEEKEILYNSDSAINLDKTTISEWYNLFCETKEFINKINTTFQNWDNAFIMYNDWTHAKTQKVHNNRLNIVKNIIKQELSNKYNVIFKEFNEVMSTS